MKIGLNTLMNIFHKKRQRITSATLFIAFFVFLIRDILENDYSAGNTFINILAFSICILCATLVEPASIYISNGEIRYSEIHFFSRSGMGGMRVGNIDIGGRSKGRSTRVNYSITDIEYIKIRQTKIEKIFNSAHFEFAGKTRFNSKKYLDKVPDRQIHYVYGINNYKKNKSYLENLILKELNYCIGE